MKVDGEEYSKDNPTQAEGTVKNGAIAKRGVPEGIDVVGNRGPAAQEDQEDKHQKKNKKAAAAGTARGLMRHQDRIVNHVITAFTSFSCWGYGGRRHCNARGDSLTLGEAVQ